MTGAELAERDRLLNAVADAQAAIATMRELTRPADAQIPTNVAAWLADVLDGYLRTIDEIVKRPPPAA